MWRQGDIFIATVPAIPAGAEPRPHCVLAEGEVTGHSHRIAGQDVARLYAHPSSLYLEVLAYRATVVHEDQAWSHIGLHSGADAPATRRLHGPPSRNAPGHLRSWSHMNAQ